MHYGVANYEAQVRFGTRVRVQDSEIFCIYIENIFFLYIFTIKILLKNTLLCLDSQNKERRRQETHYYASEVGISAVPARFKANFGLFQPFQSPADMTRFWPNQPGLA